MLEGGGSGTKTYVKDALLSETNTAPFPHPHPHPPPPIHNAEFPLQFGFVMEGAGFKQF